MMGDMMSLDAHEDEIPGEFIQADAIGGQIVRVVTMEGATLCVSLNITVGEHELRFLIPPAELPMVDKLITDLGVDLIRASNGDRNVRVEEAMLMEGPGHG